jgi:hypothetical protein
VSDRQGRFEIKALPPGEYLVRANLQGYTPSKGTLVRVAAGGRHPWSVTLSPLAAAGKPQVLTAGMAGGDSLESGAGDDENTSEVVWRLRRIPRGVLKEGEFGTLERQPGSRVHASSPARFAEVNGQINLLTTTSFERPQDLFTMSSGMPRPIAYVALMAPMVEGEWILRGAMTQGDVSSWILAGSFLRPESSTHRYGASASYSTQNYQGADPEARLAMGEGSRTVGEFSGHDTWTVNRHLTIGYGGKYGTYWYLDDPALFSGRMSVSVKPSPVDPVTVRISAAHREIAPGAEEFAPPLVGPWLPADRTFSPIAKTAFRPESVDHFEIAGEGEIRGSFIVGIRAFRQRVDDQIVTLFGMTMSEAPATVGHYQVGTAGDFKAHGWGVGLQRVMNGGLQASVDYTQFQVTPSRVAPDWDVLVRLAPGMLRKEERIHDLTATLTSRVPQTATRFLMVYKLNTAYTDSLATGPQTDARFEVQVNQELPFLDFTGAQWEVLAGIRNLYRSELFDGSVYDELLVVRPPKRVVGGLTVRF